MLGHTGKAGCLCDVSAWDDERSIASACPAAGHADAVRAVCFAPDGGMLATASDDGTVKLWRWNGIAVCSLVCGRAVRSCAWSTDSRLIAAASDTLRVWRADGVLISHWISQSY